MKKLIIWVFVIAVLLLVYQLCFSQSAKKDVVYLKDSGEIYGLKEKEIATKDADRVNIYLEDGTVIYGAVKAKFDSVSMDIKEIPQDLKTYKVDKQTKEIFKEIILEE